MKLLSFLTRCHRSVLWLKVPKNAWFPLRVVKKNILQLFFFCYGEWGNSPTNDYFQGKNWQNYQRPQHFCWVHREKSRKSMDRRWLNEGLGGGYLDQTYLSWMPKAWIRKCSFNVRCICRSSNWWCRESIVGSKNPHPGHFSWLYLKVTTHECLSKQTIQCHLTKMLGELHAKCYRNFHWCKRSPQHGNKC